MATKWKHDELAADLAESRRQIPEIVAERLQTGPSYAGAAGQMDVFSIRPSWTKPFPTCWEVKVTRQDFLQDVRRAKFEAYLPCCRRLYFATPSGLVSKKEVPDGMGLTVRNENGWHVVRAPRLRKVEHDDLTTVVFALLLRLNAPGRGGLRRLSREERVRRYSETEELAYVVAQRFRTEIRKAEHARRTLDRARKGLADVLGREPTENDGVVTLAREVVENAPAELGTAHVQELWESLKEMRESLRAVLRTAHDANAAYRQTKQIVERSRGGRL